MDDELNAEETAEQMLLFPAPGPMVVKSKTPPLKFEPQVLGVVNLGEQRSIWESSIELRDLGSCGFHN